MISIYLSVESEAQSGMWAAKIEIALCPQTKLSVATSSFCPDILSDERSWSKRAEHSEVGKEYKMATGSLIAVESRKPRSKYVDKKIPSASDQRQ
jgi:hypothetical protein